MRITKKKIKFGLVGQEIEVQKESLVLPIGSLLLGLLAVLKLASEKGLPLSPDYMPAILFYTILAGASIYYSIRLMRSLMEFFAPELAMAVDFGGNSAGVIEKRVGKAKAIPEALRIAVTLILALVIISVLLTVFMAGIALLHKAILTGFHPRNALEATAIFFAIPAAFYLFDWIGKKTGWRKPPKG